MRKELDPRSLFSHPGLLRAAAAFAVIALVASACAPAQPSTPAGTQPPSGEQPATTAPTVALQCDDVLNTAFYTDMQVPDPDIFYEVEGHQVMLMAYEGLLQYDPAATELGSAQIIPLLAESYDVSEDGLTYTFRLREGLTFADGSPVTSEDVRFSFERRTAVAQGPSYMLAGVDSYETPDARTFVVHLTQRDSAFLHYMASPYGPKVLNQEVIQANEVNGDWGQEYLRTHSAGTGPFQISEFELGDHYTLARNEHYWAGTPGFREIRIDIIPESSTQQVMLEAGDLDVINNVPRETLISFQGREGYQVILVSAVQNLVIKVNIHKPPFDRQDIREALRAAIDRDTLVPQIWGPIATPARTLLPSGVLPEGYGMDEWTYDPGPLAQLASQLAPEERQVTIVHQVGALGDARMAEALQAILLTAGFDAVVEPTPISTIFEYRDADPSVVPNLYPELEFPDATHPEAYAGIFYRTTGFLNFFWGGSEEIDAIMNQGLAATDTQEMYRLYGEAMDMLHDQAAFISIADVSGEFIARAGLTGWVRTASPRALNYTNATLCVPAE